MKRILTILILLWVGFAHGQTINTISTADTTKIERKTGTTNAELILKNGTRSVSGGYLYNSNSGTTIFRHPVIGDITSLQTTLNTLAAASVLPFGGAISSLPTVGFNPNTTDVAQWITNVFYQTQPPTSLLTGALFLELHSAGTFSTNLNWTAGRQAATATLASIVVAGVTQSFSQPSAPGTVSGTQSITVTYNTNISPLMTVTTTDSKTASAAASIQFAPNRYWGLSTGIPNNATIIAAPKELSTVKAKSAFGISIVSSTNIFYAYPSNLGALSSITIGGFESIGAFTLNVISVTNASGYVQNYNVYVSNNTFSATVTNIITQ